MKKVCKKCGQEKPLQEYHKSKDKKDGHHSYCKECASSNARKYYWNNVDVVLPRAKQYAADKKKCLQLAVDKIKADRGCSCCLEQDACCLDFHHVFEKDKDISYFVSCKSPVKIVSEIQKCICVCSNCHRKIHAGRKEIKQKPIVLDQKEIDSIHTCYSDLRTIRNVNNSP